MSGWCQIFGHKWELFNPPSFQCARCKIVRLGMGAGDVYMPPDRHVK